MINVFIALMFSIFSFQLFFASYRMNGANRVLVNLPLTLIQNSVVISEYGDTHMLYFNKESLVTNVDLYLLNNLKKYTSSYECEYLFLESNGQNICIGDKCQGVKITINASIVFDYHYHKSMIYKIGESYG